MPGILGVEGEIGATAAGDAIGDFHVRVTGDGAAHDQARRYGGMAARTAQCESKRANSVGASISHTDGLSHVQGSVASAETVEKDRNIDCSSQRGRLIGDISAGELKLDLPGTTEDRVSIGVADRNDAALEGGPTVEIDAIRAR